MKELKINGQIMGQVPTEWPELTPLQVKHICRLSLTVSSPMSMRVQLFLLITEMTIHNRPMVEVDGDTCYWMHSKKTGTVLIGMAQVMQITNCFDFLFTEHENKIFVESKLVRNHWPVLRNRRGRRLYGPDGALMNLSWEEFVRLEILYEQMNRRPDTDITNKMLAVLYRPRNPKARPGNEGFAGDLRQPFNDHLLEKMASHTSRLLPWQKLYIRMFYDGCRAFIISKHRHAFGSGGDGEDDAPDKTMLQQFLELGSSLTGNDPTKAEQLRRSLLWDVLPTMEAMGKEARRMKQKNSRKKY